MLPKIIKPSVTRNQTMCSFTIDLYGYFDYFGQSALRGRFQVGKLSLPKKSNCQTGLFSDCTDRLIFS